VSDFSSRVGYALESVETIDGNHVQIAKFPHSRDAGYRKVADKIALCVSEVMGESPHVWSHSLAISTL
jgi:hypothetical protein